MNWHKLEAQAIKNQRALIALVTAILGVLVGFGVIQPANQTAILSVVGVVFAWLGGSAYVEGKHIQALAAQAPTTSTAMVSPPPSG